MLKLLDSLRLTRVGAAGDHPLASPREAAPIFAELRAGDAMKSLEEISDWLQSVSAVDSMRLERRFELLKQLDELAQPHRIKLAREYGGLSRLARPREARLWSLNHDLWARAAAAYDDLLGRIERKEKGADSLRKEAALISVRALRAGGLRLKWLYLRYATISADIWDALARAYRFAEMQGVEQTRFAPYPGIPAETCAEEEFLRSLLLSASAPDALTPPELEIAERVIAGVAGKFHITFQPNPDSTYWVNLAEPRAPLRLAAPPALLTPGLRFFATASGHADVQGMLERLEKSGELPRGIDLGAVSDSAVVGQVLRHLRLNWAPRPPVRRSERRRVQARVSVAHGFENVLGLMRPSELDLEFGESTGIETWLVENVSQGGFGATVQQGGGDWLRIGALLATQADEGGDHWDVAIVRRIARDDRAPRVQARVGVQVVSRSPTIGVFTTNIGRWAHGVATVEGIVIPEGGEPGAVLVGLPLGLYLPGEQLLGMISEQRHLMFPVGLIERGEDYDLIKFRALVQEG